MAYVSSDMYVGIESKYNNYIKEVEQFMSEKRGVTYQNLLKEKMLEGGKLIGELRIYIKGIQEKSPKLRKYEEIMIRLEDTVSSFKEYNESLGMTVI